MVRRARIGPSADAEFVQRACRWGDQPFVDDPCCAACCRLPDASAGYGNRHRANSRTTARHRPTVRLLHPTTGVIKSIKVEGNQRIEEGTIRSYLLVQPGDRFDPDRIDRSLKTLYATGLFQDVRLGRVGNSLVVRVVENPIVNRVAYEGNHKLTDEQLRPELQLRPRAVFTPALAESDRLHILGMYAKRGYYDATVEPKIIRLDQNRVDVVFQINDGSATLVSKIVFNGNKAFSEDRLSEVINSREVPLVALPVDVGPIRSGAAGLRQGTAAPVLPEERLRRHPDYRCQRRTFARPEGVFPVVHGQ